MLDSRFNTDYFEAFLEFPLYPGGTISHHIDPNAAMNSPFRYAGGKFYARKLIMEHLVPHKCYIEPFAGGGSIFFAKSKAEENWLNDTDKELMNCYRQIKENPEGLISLLDGKKASKRNHDNYKNKYKATTPLERAFRWYYLNRTSYSGIMNPVNCYWGYGDKYSMQPKNWPANIRRTSAKLQGVRLTGWDFERVIAKAPDGAFLFIDPPYYNADQDKFYVESFSKDDHHRLAAILKEHGSRFKFLLTYDNTVEVRDLYTWADQILDKEWNYTINRTDDQKKNGNGKEQKGKRYRGKEVFILNYESVSSAHVSVEPHAVPEQLELRLPQVQK